MKNIGDNFVQRFLIDKRFTVYRHLALQFFVLLMSIEIFLDNADELNSSMERFYGWISYFLFINVIIYTNVYLLAPRFLIKDKLLIYSLLVVVLLIVSIFTVGILQELFYDISIIHEEEPNLVAVLLSTSSTFISVGLIIIGSSAILLFKHWVIYNQRAGELESATLESELKFLKSQINPHFLFNMLNNANILVDEDPEMSSQILIKLDDLLRYQINDSTKDKVYLSDDILFLTDFLDLEKTRRDHFEYSISKEGNLENIQIAPLLFIPFVENAAKHNLDSENLSYVHVSFTVQNDKLIFTCKNSKPPQPIKKKDGGLGLANIRRRLDLLYGTDYSLELEESEMTYSVNLELKL